MKDITELTLEYWDKKNNCAISTACGTIKYFGKEDVSEYYNMFMGFGKGINEGSACGAIIGVIAAMSKLMADKGVPREKILQRIEEVKSVFIKNYGSINCKRVLEDFITDDRVDYDHPKRRVKCTEIVKEMVNMVKEIITVETNPLIPIMRRYQTIHV